MVSPGRLADLLTGLSSALSVSMEVAADILLQVSGSCCGVHLCTAVVTVAFLAYAANTSRHMLSHSAMRVMFCGRCLVLPGARTVDAQCRGCRGCPDCAARALQAQCRGAPAGVVVHLTVFMLFLCHACVCERWCPLSCLRQADRLLVMSAVLQVVQFDPSILALSPGQLSEEAKQFKLLATSHPAWRAEYKWAPAQHHTCHSCVATQTAELRG